ncbi:MAG: hypothetical protein H0W89_07665 [Candidatus Levybacteria bacterium]|nr:hypothetical protein [Candidatus Levybacteria bacterium]
MLSVFGSDPDVALLVKDFALTQGILSQTESVKNIAVDKAVLEMNRPIYGTEQTRVQKLWDKMQVPVPTKPQTEPTRTEPVKQPTQNPEQRETIPDEPLTPELAMRDPEKFKSILLSHVDSKTKYAGKAWEVAVRNGIITSDIVDLDPSTMESLSHSAGISLGTKPFDAATKAQFFEDLTDYQDQIIHTFTHELNHKLLSKLFVGRTQDFDNVFRYIKLVREQTPDEGLSLLGSSKRYQEKENPAYEQAKEDLTELLTMYMINPDSLKRFLTTLSTPDTNGERARQGLATMSAEAANTVYNQIDTAVKTGLELKESGNTNQLVGKRIIGEDGNAYTITKTSGNVPSEMKSDNDEILTGTAVSEKITGATADTIQLGLSVIQRDTSKTFTVQKINLREKGGALVKLVDASGNTASLAANDLREKLQTESSAWRATPATTDETSEPTPTGSETVRLTDARDMSQEMQKALKTTTSEQLTFESSPDVLLPFLQTKIAESANILEPLSGTIVDNADPSKRQLVLKGKVSSKGTTATFNIILQNTDTGLEIVRKPDDIITEGWTQSIGRGVIEEKLGEIDSLLKTQITKELGGLGAVQKVQIGEGVLACDVKKA